LAHTANKPIHQRPRPPIPIAITAARAARAAASSQPGPLTTVKSVTNANSQAFSHSNSSTNSFLCIQIQDEIQRFNSKTLMPCKTVKATQTTSIQSLTALQADALHFLYFSTQFIPKILQAINSIRQSK
jgi:hypothetical protein